jgi:hypothetical protein
MSELSMGSTRKCIFCTETATSVEDAWPRWLLRRFPGSRSSTMHAERGAEAALESWPTKSPAIRVKRVCGGCNNTWMSQLENRAKPVIESLIDDRLDALHLKSMQSIAAWAVKTAMVLESALPPPEWFFTNQERERLRIDELLSHWTSVWIAKCVEHYGLYSACKRLRDTKSVRAGTVTASVTTMAFGSLAIQTRTLRVPSRVPPNTRVTVAERAGPWDELTLQVWPILIEQVPWPPGIVFRGEAGLHELTERFNPASQLSDRTNKGAIEPTIS